jgi:hypothetical protein
MTTSREVSVSLRTPQNWHTQGMGIAVMISTHHPFGPLVIRASGILLTMSVRIVRRWLDLQLRTPIHSVLHTAALGHLQLASGREGPPRSYPRLCRKPPVPRQSMGPPGDLIIIIHTRPPSVPSTDEESPSFSVGSLCDLRDNTLGDEEVHHAEFARAEGGNDRKVQQRDLEILARHIGRDAQVADEVRHHLRKQARQLDCQSTWNWREASPRMMHT